VIVAEMLRRISLYALLASLLVTAPGCLPLMLGSLGYQAYKYEKTGEIPGVPSKSGQSSDNTSNTGSSSSTKTQDDSIE